MSLPKALLRQFSAWRGTQRSSSSPSSWLSYALRVRLRDWAIPFYGGAPAPFIGAPGSALGLVGSRTSVAWRSGSPPHLVRPWTRSIRAKVARRGRQVAGGAERLAGAAEIVVEPTMTIVLERCAVHQLYHQRGKSWRSWRWRRGFVDPFYHGNGNGDAAAVVRAGRARHSAAAAEPMCALQRPCALYSATFVAKYSLRGLRLSRG